MRGSSYSHESSCRTNHHCSNNNLRCLVRDSSCCHEPSCRMSHHCSSNSHLYHLWLRPHLSLDTNHLCNRTCRSSSLVCSDSYSEPSPLQRSRTRVPLTELEGYFYWVSFLSSFSKERGGAD